MTNETNKLFATEIARLGKLKRTDPQRWQAEVVENKPDDGRFSRRRFVQCGKKRGRVSGGED